MTSKRISFGDNVRVRDTAVTQAAGVAGLPGCVYGETTPSVTNVEVIGKVTEDYAVNVLLDDRQESLWFAPDLLEFVDHGAGSEIAIEGLDTKLIRTASGEWEERPGTEHHQSFWQWLIGRVFGK